ncbi:MAG: nucleotidyltransferase domain-containing protein [Clostridia bacterium]|nr:nucleotidyltransferase domain-containing protein [Clostridia bacterium]
MINCEAFINNAIEFCLKSLKGYSDTNEIVNCLTTHNSLLHSRFRYSIARDIAKLLFSIYPDHVKAVKLYGSTMEYTAGVFSDIDIVIHVNHFSNEMHDTIKTLNLELSEKYFILIGKAPEEWSYFIDIHVINSDPSQKALSSRAYLEYILHNESIEIS